MVSTNIGCVSLAAGNKGDDYRESAGAVRRPSESGLPASIGGAVPPAEGGGQPTDHVAPPRIRWGPHCDAQHPHLYLDATPNCITLLLYWHCLLTCSNTCVINSSQCQVPTRHCQQLYLPPVQHPPDMWSDAEPSLVSAWLGRESSTAELGTSPRAFSASLAAAAMWPRHSLSSSASGSTGGDSPEVARLDSTTLPGKVCCGSTGMGRPADTCRGSNGDL